VKVLHVIPAVASRYGGPSSSIVEMCCALREVGASPLIATTDADGSGVLDVPLGSSTLWRGTDVIFFRRQWSEAFKYSAPLGRWLDEHVSEYELVHVHAPLSYSSLAAAGAARRHQVPYIVRPLGTLDSWSLRQKALKKRVLMPFVVRMLQRAAAVHFTSSEEMHQVQSALGTSGGVVIPLGVQAQFLGEAAVADDERTADRYVLALSRLHPVKNLESLIDAFAGLEATGMRAGWRLVVGGAGDDDYASLLDDAIARRGAAGYITRVGWMDGDAKRELVRGASVFALPSHHENFGVGLVEAMAAGCPTIVSRGVHLWEAIESARAGWVTDTSAQSIRDALIGAIQDDQSRAVRGSAARELAAEFAWPVVARRLMELYERTSVAGAHRAIEPSPLTAVPSAIVKR
jgi:glycosyltransferase involved in cell wall biosynthesis